MSKVRHIAILVASLALVACGEGRAPSASAITIPRAAAASASVPPSAEPSPQVKTLNVVRRIPVPGAGPITYGDGSLWIVSKPEWGLTREPNELNADGTPVGELYQVDPVSGDVVAHIPGAIGGFPTTGEGAVWLCTLAGGLQLVTRVDMSTHAVTRFATSDLEEYEPETVLVGGGAVWVGNNWAGEIVKVDPTTLDVVQRIRVSDGDIGGPRSFAAANGSDAWFPISGIGDVVRLDVNESRELSRLDLPDGQIDGVTLAGNVLYVAHENGIARADVAEVGSEKVLNWRREHRPAADLEVGFGSLWAVGGGDGATDDLLRLDPVTLETTGRLSVDDGTSMALTETSVWVRTKGELIEVRPD